MNVGLKIRNFIDERHIKQTWLSEKTGIPTDKLSLSLKGRRRLTFEEYESICWALGVGVDKFLSPTPPINCPAIGTQSIQEGA